MPEDKEDQPESEKEALEPKPEPKPGYVPENPPVPIA